MPAAAVIPAPIAYIKIVAVKKLVVGFQHLGRICYCVRTLAFLPSCILLFHFLVLNCMGFDTKELL